jgi:hypothetical protein
MPATSARRPREPSAQPLSQRFRLDEVGEGSLAVDLDDGDRLAVGGLERGVAADVHELEIVAADLAHDLERPLAELAAVRPIEDDARQG